MRRDCARERYFMQDASWSVSNYLAASACVSEPSISRCLARQQHHRDAGGSFQRERVKMSCAYSSWCDCITTHLGEFYIYCRAVPPVWENEGEYARTIYVDGEEWTPEWEDLNMTPSVPQETSSNQFPTDVTEVAENIMDFTSSVTEYMHNTVSSAVQYTSEIVTEPTTAPVTESETIYQDILRESEPVLDSENHTLSNLTESLSDIVPDLTQIKEVVDTVAATVKSTTKDAVHNVAGNN